MRKVPIAAILSTQKLTLLIVYLQWLFLRPRARLGAFLWRLRGGRPGARYTAPLVSTAHCTMTAPLPIRDGIAPSFLWLPTGCWPSLLAFLLQRFVHVDETVLLARMARGEVVDDAGRAYGSSCPYRPQTRVWYYREVAEEPPIPFEADILHRDEQLLVVDKPHFLATTPGGRYLQQTLLVRLRKQLDAPQLTPIHRLDRETAGVVLFSLQPASRGAYQRLFEQRAVHKEYEAVAPFREELSLPCVHQSRMVESEVSFVMQEALGPANSATQIELLERRGELALYRLAPQSGRKHQLRLHMASLGIPILHDTFYPQLLPQAADDYGRPLQLLARAIAFADPVSGEARYFASRRTLAAWV